MKLVRSPQRLPRDMTIRVATETARALNAWMATLGPHDAVWHLDGSGVEEADAAGVQLLLAVSRSASAAGARLKLDMPSAALCRASHQLGIAPMVLGTMAHEGAA